MKAKQISEIDTFAQWDQNQFKIDIILPSEPNTKLIDMTYELKESSEHNNEKYDVTLHFDRGEFQVNGEISQVVKKNTSMKPTTVSVNPQYYKKMFPITWIKTQTRPSGIKIVGDTGLSLTFSGVPTSDDTIAIPELINKFNITVTHGSHSRLDSSVTDEDLWFIDVFSILFTPDEGYKWIDSDISKVNITPASMKNNINISLTNGKIKCTLKDNIDIKTLSNVSITTPPTQRSTYRVEVALGSNMTSSGGSPSQNVVIGQSMTQINLTTTNGMTFFPTIHNQSQNGITLNVDTSSTPHAKAWISGTPLRDTQMTVKNAVKGAKLTVKLPSDGTVIAKSGDESKLNQFIQSGTAISNITLVPSNTTNYYMTQEWKKSIKVEPTNDKILLNTSDAQTSISGSIVDNTVITIPTAVSKITQHVKFVLGSNITIVEGSLTNNALANTPIKVKIKANNNYYFPGSYNPTQSGSSGTGTSGVKSRNASEIVWETNMNSCDLTVTFPAAVSMPGDGLFLTIGQSGTRYGWDSQVSPVYGDLRKPMIFSWPAICIWCDKLSNGNYRIEMRASNSPSSSGNRIAISFYLTEDGAPSTATYFKNFKVENGIGIWWTEENTDRLGNIYKYLQARKGKIVDVLLADYDAQSVSDKLLGGY